MQCSIKTEKKFFVLEQSVCYLTEESKGQTNQINNCQMTDYLGQNSGQKRLKTFEIFSVETTNKAEGICCFIKCKLKEKEESGHGAGLCICSY